MVKIKEYLSKIDTYSVRSCYCKGESRSWLNFVYSIFGASLALAIFLIIFIALQKFVSFETNTFSDVFLFRMFFVMISVAGASFVAAVTYLLANYIIWVVCGRPIKKKQESLE